MVTFIILSLIFTGLTMCVVTADHNPINHIKAELAAWAGCLVLGVLLSALTINLIVLDFSTTSLPSWTTVLKQIFD